MLLLLTQPLFPEIKEWALHRPAILDSSPRDPVYTFCMSLLLLQTFVLFECKCPVKYVYLNCTYLPRYMMSHLSLCEDIVQRKSMNECSEVKDTSLNSKDSDWTYIAVGSSPFGMLKSHWLVQLHEHEQIRLQYQSKQKFPHKRQWCDAHSFISGNRGYISNQSNN